MNELDLIKGNRICCEDFLVNHPSLLRSECHEKEETLCKARVAGRGIAGRGDAAERRRLNTNLIAFLRMGGGIT